MMESIFESIEAAAVSCEASVLADYVDMAATWTADQSGLVA